MKLPWIAPGRTPGIDSTVRGVPTVTLVRWVVFGVALASTLALAVLPQFDLSRIVSRSRTLAMRSIERRLPTVGEVETAPDRRAGQHLHLLTLLSQIASSPSSTVTLPCAVPLVLR